MPPSCIDLPGVLHGFGAECGSPGSDAGPDSPPKATLKLKRHKASRAGKTRGKTAPTASSSPPRPMNAFMLWQREHRPMVLQRAPELQNHMVSIKLGELWKEMVLQDPEKKAHYQEKERVEKAAHANKYPNYKYQPKKRTKTAGRPATKKTAKPKINRRPRRLHESDGEDSGVCDSPTPEYNRTKDLRSTRGRLPSIDILTLIADMSSATSFPKTDSIIDCSFYEDAFQPTAFDDDMHVVPSDRPQADTITIQGTDFFLVPVTTTTKVPKPKTAAARQRKVSVMTQFVEDLVNAPFLTDDMNPSW